MSEKDKIMNSIKANEINKIIKEDTYYKGLALRNYMIKACITKCNNNFKTHAITKEQESCSNDCLYSMLENFRASTLE